MGRVIDDSQVQCNVLWESHIIGIGQKHSGMCYGTESKW